MPIFISYSHSDSAFVDTLAGHLVKHKARVWVDRWELNVGDSLIDRIQSALQTASALIVVLSKASVESEWCKKEFSAGLLRELEERRVVVLPALKETCDIPIFLRGKMYADFRSDFDTGLKTILEAVARVTSEALGRLENPEWHTDWSVDWGMREGLFFLRITMVEQAKDQPYTVLSEIEARANEVATARYLTFQEEDLGWIERLAIIGMISTSMNEGNHQFIIDDQFPQVRSGVIRDRKSGAAYEITATARRLGGDTGKAVFFDFGSQVKQISEGLEHTLREPTADEGEKIQRLRKKLKLKF
jgi:hypothetical protein